MTEELTERIREIMQEYNCSSSIFADKIGIQRSAVSHILSGRNRASIDVILKILKVFPQINTHWLLTGEGKMTQLNLFEKETLTKEDTSNISFVAEPQKTDSESSTPKKPPIQSTVPEDSVLLRNENINYYKSDTYNHSTLESNIQNPMPQSTDRSDSEGLYQAFTSEKKIDKIVFFYCDKTFSVYKPE